MACWPNEQRHGAPDILSNVVTVIAAFVSMILLSWQLTIISLIVMPIFVFVQIRVGKRRQRLAKRTQQSLSELTSITEESLGVSGILLSKVFNRADAEVERYAAENRRQTRLQLKNAMTGQTFFSVVSTFFGLTPAIIYLVAGWLLSNGNPLLTAGTVIAFTTLQARLQMPLVQLMRVTLDVQTSLALFRRLFEYLDMVPAIQDRPGAKVLDLATLRGEIEFRDVWFRYPEPRVLSDSQPRVPDASAGISRGHWSSPPRRRSATPPARPRAAAWRGDVDLVRGQRGRRHHTGLVGHPTGGRAVGAAGHLVEGSARPDGSPGRPIGLGQDDADLSGAAAARGDPRRGADRRHRRPRRDADSLSDAVGMVTQEPYLFHGTIADNLRYAKQGATDAEVVAAAQAANIHDRIMSFADGYETITGARGFRLSGGEKQRLSIARVLLMDPKILILGEATSALDTATERLVQEALDRAMANRTTLAIAHRLSTIMNADVIFGLEDGRLVESGTHDELLAKGGLYAHLYAEQFGDGRWRPASTTR